ncbi:MULTISPECIES: hypothetical protein [unclassified Wolbachia]|uniref:hypothetical protein n=1 Tax=unclassified Wolbachia TaxID=2640676 RepID=UPI0019B5E3B1|nr:MULTISPECIES: hypothetical protein [unclassified Wolbachia]MBC6685897.1 hypothetical protein [Wolbachia pipientis]
MSSTGMTEEGGAAVLDEKAGFQTGMTPFAVQFTFKNECSYSCARYLSIDSANK